MIKILLVLIGILLLFVILFFFRFLRYIMFRNGAAILKTDYNEEVLIANVLNTVGTNKFKIKDWRQPIGNKIVGEVQFFRDRAIVRINREDVNGNLFYRDIGEVDANGTIYSIDSSGNRVQIGSCDPKGKRSWKQLWLVNHTVVKDVSGNEIGRCTEKIRLGRHKSGITLLTRTAAVLLLYEPSLNDEYVEKRSTGTVKLSQVALFGSLIYAATYFIFERVFSWHITFPWLGQDFSFLASMILVYFALLGIVWFILYDMSQSGSIPLKFLQFLQLINRNTGIRGWNSFLILTLILACMVCFSIDFFPLFPFYLSLLIGVTLNLLSTSAPWKIIHPADNYINIPTPATSHLPGVALPDPYATIPAADLVTQNYNWRFFSTLKGKDIAAFLPLQFSKSYIDKKREKNPFWGANNSEAIKNLYKSADQILDMSSDINDDDESKWNLDLILKKISEVSRRENLSHYETMQLILSFCQTPNFTWILDHECEEINPNRKDPYDYFRFPIETLYDKRGDCDCTAMLAYRLFNRAGINAKYLLMKKGDVKHAAVAIEKNDNIQIDDESLVTINGKKFYFCETVGSQWYVGVLPDAYKERVREFENEILVHPERILG